VKFVEPHSTAAGMRRSLSMRLSTMNLSWQMLLVTRACFWLSGHSATCSALMAVCSSSGAAWYTIRTSAPRCRAASIASRISGSSYS
jgi:hypothetical protein